MQIDHVVLWVDDPKRALEFYVDVIGLEAVRAQEFEDGNAPFPSVRVNDSTIIDLMNRAMVPFVREFTAGGESGGAPVNHVCLSMGAPPTIRSLLDWPSAGYAWRLGERPRSAPRA